MPERAATNVLPEDAATSEHEAAAAPAKPNRGLGIILGVGALLAVAGGTWYVTHRGLEDTDDAQIDADVTAIPAQTAAVVKAVHFVEN